MKDYVCFLKKEVHDLYNYLFYSTSALFLAFSIKGKFCLSTESFKFGSEN